MLCYFQILIGFYGQAILTLVLSTWFGVLWFFFHNRSEGMRRCLNDLNFGLVTDWVAVGLAMTIAALSQWGTISIFHLFLCASFAMTIPTEDLTQSSFMSWQQDRLRTIYFMVFRMLRIVLLCNFIYRLVRFWGSAPGQCFSLSATSLISDDVNEKILIVARHITFYSTYLLS